MLVFSVNLFSSVLEHIDFRIFVHCIVLPLFHNVCRSAYLGGSKAKFL
jgi:hypothetical protein